MLCYCRIKPAVNQIELNPRIPQNELVKFLKSHNILTVAYSPIGCATMPESHNGRAWEDLQDN